MPGLLGERVRRPQGPTVHPTEGWSRRLHRRGIGRRDLSPYQGHTRKFERPIGEMSYRETQHLRVLIANERRDRLALVAPIVAALGHEVIAREIEVNDVGPVTARERPDVALVGLGASSGHALMLIEKIVQEAACPVIVLVLRSRPRVRPRGIQARRVRLHHRR